MRNEKGITLVALVITIVVLVILVGVTLSITINSGIITNARNAVAKYNEVQANEIAQLNKIKDKFAELNGTGETPEEPETPDAESTDGDEEITAQVANYRIYGSAAGVGDAAADGSGTYQIPIRVRGENIVNITESCDEDFRGGVSKGYNLTTPVFDNAWVLKELKPNTTYMISCDITCTAIYETRKDNLIGFVLFKDADEFKSARQKSDMVAEGTYSLASSFTTPSNLDGYALNAYTNKFEEGYANAIFSNVQIIEGNTASSFVEYDGVDISIALNAPLRSVTIGENTYTDYIDSTTGKVYRYVKWNETTSAYEGLSTPEVEEPVNSLPTIPNKTGTLRVRTTVTPSKIEIWY